MGAFGHIQERIDSQTVSETSVFEHADIIRAKEQKTKQDNVASLKKAADEIRAMLDAVYK